MSKPIISSLLGGPSGLGMGLSKDQSSIKKIKDISSGSINKSEEDDSYVTNYVRSLFSGMASIASGAAKAPALAYSIQATLSGRGLLDKDPSFVARPPEILYRNAITNALDEASARHSYMNERWHSNDENLLSLIKKKKIDEIPEYLAHAVVSNIPQQLAIVAATLSGVGTPALIALASTSAGSAYEKGLSKSDEGVSTDQAFANAVLNGAAEYTFERLGTMKVTKQLQKTFSKAFGVKAGEKVIKNTFREISKSVLRGAMSEGTEEALTEISQGLSENITGVDSNSIGDIMAQSFEAGIVGALSSATVTAPTSGFGTAKDHVDSNYYKKTVEKYGGEYKGISKGYTKKNGKKVSDLVYFNNSEGSTLAVKRDDFNPIDVKKKLDPDFKKTREYTDTYIESFNEKMNLNKLKNRIYQKRISDLAGGKKKDSMHLDELLHKAGDFLENPDFLNKKLADTYYEVIMKLEPQRINDEGFKREIKRIADKKFGTETVKDRLSKEDLSLYEEAQQRLDNDPEFVGILQDILSDITDRAKEYQDAGLLLSTRQIYVPRNYVRTDQFDPSHLKKRRLDATKSTRERLYDTLGEALAFGKIPSRKTLTGNYLNYVDRLDNAVLTSKLKKMLIDEELVTVDNIDGYERLGDDLTFAIVKKLRDTPKANFTYKTIRSKDGRSLSAALINNEIYINKEQASKDFNNKEWTRPKVEGVNPLPPDIFKNENDWFDFLIEHEDAHINNKRKPEESAGEYENRINEIALENLDKARHRLRPLYAPKEIANEINLVFKDTPLKDIKWLETIRKINNFSKKMRLATGLFHHVALEFQYYYTSTNVIDSVKELARTGDIKKFRDDLDPFRNYKHGLELWESNQELISKGIKEGNLTLGRIQDWDDQFEQRSSKLYQLISKHKVPKKIADTIIDYDNWYHDFLFNRLAAGLKIKSYLFLVNDDMVSRGLKAPDLESIKAAAMSTNENFGGLPLKAMRRNPTVQYIWKMFSFAPDWQESNFRLYAAAFMDKGKISRDLHKRIISRVITKYIIASTLLSFVMAAMREPEDKERDRLQQLVDNFVKGYSEAWTDGKINWIRVNVTPFLEKFGAKDNYHFNIAGVMLEPTKWVSRDIRKGLTGPESFVKFFTPERIASSLLKSAYYKSAALPQMISDYLLSTDYTFWRRYTSFEELIDQKKISAWHKGRRPVRFEEIPSWSIYESRKFIPLQINTIIDYTLGQIEGVEGILKGVGLEVKPGYTKARRKKLEGRTPAAKAQQKKKERADKKEN